MSEIYLITVLYTDNEKKNLLLHIDDLHNALKLS